MKILRVFFILAFAFVLPLTLAGLSSLPSERTQNAVIKMPTVKTVRKAESVRFAAHSGSPQTFSDFEPADSFTDVILHSEEFPSENFSTSRRPRHYLRNSDSWRFRQKSFVLNYKSGNQTADYPSKSLPNLNKSSPLRR